MKNEKKTRTMRCSWCARVLPETSFPIKQGYQRVRYKVCRECLALGHSVLRPEPKPKRIPMTPEERVIHRREYFRNYRKKNAEKFREYVRRSAERKAAGKLKQKQKRVPKPKPVAKPKAKPVVENRTCIVCKRTLPVESFMTVNGKRTHSNICIDCRPNQTTEQIVEKEPEVKPVPKLPIKPVVVKEKGCTRCKRYPCFQGIENLESDFSKTCKQFEYGQ